MGFWAFFKKGKKSPPSSTSSQHSAPADESEDIDLPSSACKDKTDSNFKPAPPSRTTFNKPLVIGLSAILLISSLVAMIYALQTPKQQSKNTDTKPGQQLKGKNAFDTLPSNYSSIKNQDKKPAVPAVIPIAPTGKAPSAPQIPVAPQISLAEREAMAAQNSGIGFGGKGGNSQLAAPAASAAATNPFLQQLLAAGAVTAQAAGAGAQMSPDPQDQKTAFFEKNRSSAWYVKGGLTPALSEYEVKAGSIIPGVMLTGIKSDLPGQVVGQVRANVYDSLSGEFLLIPQGTKIIGTYDSKITYGQDRVLLVWTRLIFPNGESLDLESMEATDSAGYSGLSDRTNNHTGKLITGILLGSVATGISSMATGSSTSDNLTAGQSAAQGAATNVSNAMSDITRKNLNIQPTIEIRPGWKFNVFVNKDLILKPYAD